MATKHKFGDRIYYSGDVCNMDGWFTIAALPDGNLYLREQGGENRDMHIRPSQVGDVYAGHCNPRFVTEAAYMAYRRARLTA